jgi:hypothetical protein
MTGVGIAAGLVYLFGSDTAFTASVSAALLLVGITLLTLGFLARRAHRP